MLTWELEERGIEAVLAGSCAEARRAAQSTAFDLMLVDADLPDGDGVGLAEHLAGTLGDTTVVIYSGRHGIRGACGERPAVRAVLTKPVRVWEILALLRANKPVPESAEDRAGGTPLAQWLRSGSSPTRRAPRGASDAGVGGKALRIEDVETDIEADDPGHPAARWVDRVATASPG
jgi:DNA-binding NtrC family response regulator